MPRCEACGSEVPAGTRYCTSCGAVLAGPLPAPADDPKSLFREYLLWNRKIPLITNPYLVLQCLLIPTGIGVLIGIFIAVIAEDLWVITGFTLLGLALGILFLLIMLVLQLLTGGGLETEFFISDRGVAHSAGKTTRALNRVSAGGSAVLGSAGGTGAGLIAMSQEENMLRWKDVRYIAVYPRTKSMVFRSRYLISPVVLYCTDENFDAVRAMAKRYAPAVAAKGL